MARKKHLINVHTSTGTTAPTGASLYLGEIAVQHTPSEPALWIKVGTSEASTDYEKFIGSTEIQEMISSIGSNNTLGSGYTYSGLPYVNSATTIADAYSALTYEMIKDEKVTSAALNNLNDRVTELSSNTISMGIVNELSASVVSNKTDVNAVSSNVNSLSASVVSDIANLNSLSASVVSNKTNVGAVSGDVMSLSAAVITISGNSGGGGTGSVTGATLNGNAVTLTDGNLIFSGVMTETEELAIANALNDLNSRLTELSGNTQGGVVPEMSTNISQDRLSMTKTAAAAAVYNEVHPRVASSQPGSGMFPNVAYFLGTLTGNTTFTFATPLDDNILNHYFFTFETDSTAPTITWPSDIRGWVGGVTPTINANKAYQVSVIEGYAIIAEF